MEGIRKVPVPIWRLADFIFNHGPETENLFLSTGFEEEVSQIQNCLDAGTSIPDELATEAGLLSAAELLLRFLDSLPDSVIPSEHYQEAINACEDPKAADEVPLLLLSV